MAKVLIVEDDPDVSDMVEQILLFEGHEVRVARDGEDGMLRVHEEAPDVAILDIEMPVLSGPGMALRMFAHNCGLEKVPVILMSGHVELDRIAEEVGTPYRLSKPFDIEALTTLVSRASQEKVPPRPRSNEVAVA